MVLLFLACTARPEDSSPTVDTGPFPVGTLALRFDMDHDYREAMEEEAIGPFEGSFWRADQVDALGPMEGAEDLGGISVAEVDLTGEATDVLFTSMDLPPVEVVVLGFIDSDLNAADGDGGPDKKDPVTLPNENRFQVVSGAESEVTVYFGFLHP